VVRYRGDAPGKTYRITGSVLHISTDCGRHCTVAYDIQAPPKVAVRGDNGSGDVRLTDVAAVDVRLGSGNVEVTNSSADVAVETGSGNVTVRAVAGAFRATAGSGNIDARDVMTGPTRVNTGSGDVTLVIDRPGDVHAEASSGNVKLTVPDGRYRVRATTGAGDTDLGVRDDPAGEHQLTLDTGSGDITVVSG
jgi:DUF4097 and DUF4098 domain-containing protein YvlB